MNYKTTLALFAAAVVVGILIAIDRTHPPVDKQNTYLFQSFKDDEVRSVEIVSADRSIAIEKRTEAAEPWWEIVKPIQAPADKQIVSNLLSDLRWNFYRALIKEDAAKAQGDANYGLDKPQAVLTCKTPGRTYALKIGGANPIKDDEVFARVEERPVPSTLEGQIVVLDKKILETLKKPVEELRDRALFTIESFKADKLNLTIGREEVELVKKEADWLIEKPEEIKEKADYTPVSSLLTNLKDLRWKDWTVEKPKPEDLDTYGLKTPAARFTVSATDAKKTETLLVGARKPKDPEKDKDSPDLTYVRKGEDGPVVTVETSAAGKLPKKVDHLRTKKIWTVSANDLAKVELRLGNVTTVIEQPIGSGWTYVKPEGLKTEASLVTDLVSALEAAEVVEFYERKMASPKTYGFDQPAAWLGLTTRKTTSVVSGEGAKRETKIEEKLEPQVWLFGRSGGRVFVKREDRGQVVEIKPDLLDKKLRLGTLLFRSKTLIATKPEDVQTLTVERMERGQANYAKYACAREAGQWALKEPAGGTIEPQNVNAAVGALYALRASEWVIADDKVSYGLDKPPVRVHFTWTETREVQKEKKEESGAGAKEGEKKEGAKADSASPAADKKPEGDKPPAAKPEEKKAEAEKKPEEKKEEVVKKVTTTLQKVLWIGNPTPSKETCYARFADDPAIFTLLKSTVDKLDQALTK
jgi:hypothetical protein